MMKKIVYYAVILSFSSVAYASGFQSLEQSAATLGQADAGTAITNDASAEFYNPAAMVQFKEQTIAVSSIGVLANVDFIPSEAKDYNGNNITGTKKGPGTNAMIPAIHYIYPMSPRVALGFGINVPTGLATDYGADSMARYYATKSNIVAINLAPSLAYRITPKLAFGLGFDVQHMMAEQDQVIDGSKLTGGVLGDVSMINKANGWSMGWNAGLFYQHSPLTHFGLAYRSGVSHHLQGRSHVYGIDWSDVAQSAQAQSKGIIDNDVRGNVTLPDTITFSALHKFNPRLSAMGDLQYTLWSRVSTITMTFFSNPSTHTNLPPGTIVLNYHNSWRVALGAKYQANNRWTVKGGLAFDQTPTNDSHRIARIPDTNRYWLSAGANLKITPKIDLDLGYAHIFFEHSTMREATDALKFNASLVARYKAYANLFGAQLNIRI